jgi:ATP-binding cassette, subfamily B, multidrug efflux pump
MSSSTSTAREPARDYRAQMIGRGPGRPAKIEKAQDPRQALLRLLPYLKPYRAKMILVLGFVSIYTVLDILGPYLMGLAIDRFISVKQVAGLALFCIWMLVVYLLDNVFQAASNWVMASVSQGALKGVRRDLFGRLQELPLNYFDAHPAGELMSRLTNDIEAINQALAQNVIALLGSALAILGILIAMFVINYWLALASLVVVPLMFWFTNFIARYTRKGFRVLQKQLGELNAVMEEAISGQRVIKAFRRSDSALESFRQHNQEVYKAGVYANTYALLLMPFTNILGDFFIIVMAGAGGWLALHNLVSVGMIATFIAYGRNFVQPLRALANIYNTLQAALAGAERVFEIIDMPPEIPDAPEARSLEKVQGQVDFTHVSFAYRPGAPVIKDMTLSAQPGRTIALVGPTGAGKTTITNLLTRFYEIDEGSIQVDGVDICQIKRDNLRGQLGLVLQDTYLFADTVMENIRYGRLDASDADCIAAAEMAEADHFIHLLPHGYQTRLSERASNLSQGQRQMLAIARAILADPGILILDEATSSVDTRTELRIQQGLLKLMQGRTSFVIAHRLSTIREADLVVVIDHGEIVEKGTHQELLDRRGFYYHLYVSQFKGQAI